MGGGGRDILTVVLAAAVLRAPPGPHRKGSYPLPRHPSGPDSSIVFQHNEEEREVSEQYL